MYSSLFHVEEFESTRKELINFDLRICSINVHAVIDSLLYSR